ncbi:MAG: RNA polymerase sigma factor [Acidimicrobiia bacterium]|nr:RNA polymerase sigma factor [Acidimicrobiia bacterium]
MAEEPIVDRVRTAYESTHARLWRSVLAFSGSREIADDAVAEAFAQVLRSGDEVRNVEAWAWRSAFAIARGELSRRTATGPVPDVADEPMPEPAVDLIRTLRQLPALDRELLVLVHIGGWTPSELAEITSTPASTVRVRLYRANRRARALFAQGVDR